MKDEIKQVLMEWQEERVKKFFNRGYCLDYAEEINTVIGLRRCGKTYFLFQEIEKLVGKGIPPSHILYINFDDERLAELQSKQLQFVLDAYFELFPGNIGQQVYLFFDEIQSVDNWHLFVKRLYERKRYHIVLTGSSSKLLGKEIATELRGRTTILDFFPLNFREFLGFKGFDLKPNIEYSQDRFPLMGYASEFMKFGGFPRVALEEPEHRKKSILKDYLDMIIFRDIVERYDTRNIHLLRAIINYLLANFASEFSVNGFIKKFKKEYQPNKVTVFNYFSYLEETGFLYYLPLFSFKVHQRYISKKNYIGDNGFISLLAFRGMEISGRLLENLVFTELNKLDKTLFYYKDSRGYECDFLITEEEQVRETLQVTHKLTRENREREIRGLLSALKVFGLTEGVIITSGQSEAFRESGFDIRVIPYWQWMLQL
jgi:predicted AAA+ superfamily ATPase